MKSKLSLVLLFIFVTSMSVFAETYTSKYVGEEYRKIKSLSPDDVEELKKGGGWGLAKAAELNGLPGPAHILEMEDKINGNKDGNSIFPSPLYLEFEKAMRGLFMKKKTLFSTVFATSWANKPPSCCKSSIMCYTIRT